MGDESKGRETSGSHVPSTSSGSTSLPRWPSPQMVRFFQDRDVVRDRPRMESTGNAAPPSFKPGKHLFPGDPWHEAVTTMDLSKIEAQIKKGVDVNQVVARETPLRRAAGNSLAITKLLLNAGAEVDGTYPNTGTPLQMAVRSTNTEAMDTVKLLLDRGADVNAPPGPNGTALYAAVSCSYRTKGLEMVDLLLTNGANANEPSAGLLGTALAAAAAKSTSAEVAASLLKKGADPNPSSNTGDHNPLLIAVCRGDEDTVRVSMEAGADASVTYPLATHQDFYMNPQLGGPALVIAAERGNLPMVANLLAMGAPIDLPNEAHGPPVVAAAFAGKLDVALFLLRNGASTGEAEKWWSVSQGRCSTKKSMPRLLKNWMSAEAREEYAGLDPLYESMPVSNDYSGTVDRVRFQWRVPDIVKHLGSLDNNVLILGSFDSVPHYEAILCSEYIKRRFTSLQDIRIARQLVGSNEEQMWLPPALREYFNDQLVTLHPCLLPDCLTVSPAGDGPLVLTSLIPSLKVLDWICKAIRPPNDGVGCQISGAVYRFSKYQLSKTEIGLELFMELSDSPVPATEYDCWMSLLNGSHVLQSNLVRSRRFGKGLEMSFELMVAMAGVEYALVIDDGIVFVGYQTVLVPTAIEGDSAQFHLHTSDKGQINPHRIDMGPRVRQQDAAKFKPMRCFLGWSDAVQVNLGTQNLTATVRYSDGRRKGKSLHLKGFSPMAQIGYQGLLSGVVGLQVDFEFATHQRQFKPFGGYCKLLRDTSGEVALVYDAAQQRGWLVQKLSLLLHMCHAYGIVHGVALGTIPFAECHADARDLPATFESLGDSVILGSAADTDRLLFRQLMLGLNMNLLDSIASTRECKSKTLYGFEFLDVVTSPGRGSFMKELDIVPTGRDWLAIVDAVDAVVVCSDIGDVITAVRGTSRRSELCNSVPRNLDYLAATIPSMKILAERKSGDLSPQPSCRELKISEACRWDMSSDPFHVCNHENHDDKSCWTSGSMVQRLVSSSWITLPGRSRVVKQVVVSNIPLGGGVVFGKP